MKENATGFLDSIAKAKLGDCRYLDSVWRYLYQSSDWQKVVARIKAIPLPKGLCAKKIGKEDVSWFCKDCGKDANCTQCQECFEGSNHAGHLVYLDRNVTGICDCGDANSWSEAGFCRAHQGFVEESKANVSLLPEPVAKVAPVFLEVLANRYFNLVCHLRFTASPSSGNYSEVLKEISTLTAYFIEISDTSPIFLYLMARSLSKRRTRYTVEREDPGRAVVTLADPLNIIDIVLKANELLSEDMARVSVELLVKHLKTKAFKYELAKSFVVHYPRIVRNELNSTSKGLGGISVQVLSLEEVAREVFSSPHLYRPLLITIKDLFSEITFKNISRRSGIMSTISRDLKYIFRGGAMNVLLEGTFLAEYLEVCSSYTAAIRLSADRTQQHIDERIYVSALEIELALTQIFHRIASCIDYTDENYCKQLAKVFKGLLMKLKEQCKRIKESYYNIPVHRFLAYFLISYSHTHFLLKRMIEGKEFRSSVRAILKDLFQTADDGEFNRFILRVIYPVLKAVGFYMEGFAGKWRSYGRGLEAVIGKYATYDHSFVALDFALLSLLLSALNVFENEYITKFIIGGMSQNGRWLETFILQLLLDTPEGAKERPKDKDPNYARMVGLLDNFLFSLAGLCSNDCLTLPAFFNSTKGKYFKQQYHESLKETVNQLKSYGYKKWLVHSYFSLNELWTPYKNIEGNVSKNLRRDYMISEEFGGIFKSGMDAEKGIEAYMLFQSYADLYSPYFYLLKPRLANAGDKLRKLHKHVNDPRKFDPLFGVRGEEGSMFDLTGQVAGLLAASKLSGWLTKLLARASKGELNNAIILSTLKLMKSFKQHVTKDMITEWTPKIAEALQYLQKPLAEFNTLLVAYGNEFGVALPAVQFAREDSKEVGLEDLETSFGSVDARYELRGSLGRPKYDVCVVCRENVAPENFVAKPYGRCVHIAPNNVYEHYLRQNGVNSKGCVEGLSLNACGHSVHYKCFGRLPEGVKYNVLTFEDVVAGWRANLNRRCASCKQSVTTLCPPAEALKEHCRDRTVKNLLEKVVSVLLTVSNPKMKSGEVRKRAETENFVEHLCEWLVYSIKIAAINKADNALAESEIYLSILYATRWLFFYNNPKGRISDSRKPYPAQREFKYLEEDTLKLLVRELIWTKLEENVTAETINSITMRWLHVTLWQAIVKCAIEGCYSLIDADMRGVNEFVSRHELVIRSLCLKWLQSAKTAMHILLETSNELLEELFMTLVQYLSVIIDSEGLLSEDPNEMLNDVKRTYFENIFEFLSIPLGIKALGLSEQFRFVKLEDKFTDCLRIHYKRRCKDCNRQVKDNTLCLLCADILCFGSNCCQRNKMDEIIYHAQVCSKGTGVFLYFHTNKILLVDDIRCQTYPSPYVNSRGEDVDMSTRVFEVLNLNRAKVQKLKAKVLTGRVAATIDADRKS